VGPADLRLGDILRDRDILEDPAARRSAAAEEARAGRIPAVVVEQMIGGSRPARDDRVG